jgi:hypothetical protein
VVDRGDSNFHIIAACSDSFIRFVSYICCVH